MVFTRDITVPIQMITLYGEELSNFQMFKDEHTLQNFLSHYVTKLSSCTSKYSTIFLLQLKFFPQSSINLQTSMHKSRFWNVHTCI